MISISVSERQRLRKFRWLLAAASLATFFVIVVGSAVRATGSGLACPDWPLCFGQVVPEFTFQVFIEWFHRVAAGSLVLALFLILRHCWKFRITKKYFSSGLVLGAVLMIAQVILGGLTVLKLLDPTIVSIHLINASLLFGLLLAMTLRAHQLSRQSLITMTYRVPRLPIVVSCVLLALIFLQISLGGAVSTNGAGLACPDFPTCHGRWFPGASFHASLQMFHRGVGIAVSLLTLVMWGLCIRLRLPPLAQAGVRALPLLVIAQIAIGATGVLIGLPVWSSVLHLAVAQTILAVSLLTAVELMTNTESYRPAKVPIAIDARTALGKNPAKEWI